MSRRKVLWTILAVYLIGLIVLVAVTGWKTHHSNFKPQDEFKLDNWVSLGIFSINKAVLYLFIAAILTTTTMLYVARRMTQRPNRVQTAVEIV